MAARMMPASAELIGAPVPVAMACRSAAEIPAVQRAYCWTSSRDLRCAASRDLAVLSTWSVVTDAMIAIGSCSLQVERDEGVAVDAGRVHVDAIADDRAVRAQLERRHCRRAGRARLPGLDIGRVDGEPLVTCRRAVRRRERGGHDLDALRDGARGQQLRGQVDPAGVEQLVLEVAGALAPAVRHGAGVVPGIEAAGQARAGDQRVYPPVGVVRLV